MDICGGTMGKGSRFFSVRYESDSPETRGPKSFIRSAMSGKSSKSARMSREAPDMLWSPTLGPFSNTATESELYLGLRFRKRRRCRAPAREAGPAPTKRTSNSCFMVGDTIRTALRCQPLTSSSLWAISALSTWEAGMDRKILAVLLGMGAILICQSAAAGAKPSATQFGLPALSRDDFNRLAVDAGVPLFWKADSNKSGTVEPGELIPVGAGAALSPYVGSGFTNEFRDAYAKLVEMRRRETVKRELDFGYPTLLESDFRRASAADRKVVGHVVAAGKIIEELYGIQNGSAALRSKIPQGDTTALALFYRNQGPWCEAPRTQEDPFCNAIASFPPKLSDAYPEGMAQDEAMCKSLRKMKDGKKLLDPFTVVRREGGKLVALPLTAVYGERMKAVAAELKAAAGALGKGEEPFARYLLAAAKGFETNSWEDADEAWVGMTSKNSRWYLRVAPDETYFDPC